MFQPDDFRVEDVPEMHALMRGRPFAALVSAGAAGLYASHLPTVLKDDGPHGVIECHLASANPHCIDLAVGGEALMIFQGPEGYITPNWYPSKTVHGKAVPTWNYAVVHAYGRPEVMQEADWLGRHVGELSAQQEASEEAAAVGCLYGTIPSTERRASKAKNAISCAPPNLTPSTTSLYPKLQPPNPKVSFANWSGRCPCPNYGTNVKRTSHSRSGNLSSANTALSNA